MICIEEQKIMLYSPRQMEVATLLAGPICAVYMLTANYNRLEKLEYARNVTFFGSIIVLLWHLIPVSDKVPQMVYQTLPLDSVGDLQEIPYFKTGYTGEANIHFSFKLDSLVSFNNWIHSNSYFFLHLLLFLILIRPY